MEILITNDDGIDAPGLAALRMVALTLGEVTTVAPAGPMSLCGHRVTTEEPLVVHERGERTYAVEGTPADCVRIAVSHPDIVRPDLVLSGINSGGNLGVDIYISGTAAAAREAVIQGLPAIALSHYIRRGVTLDWQVAADRAASAIEVIREKVSVLPGFWNVNLPHLDEEQSEEIPLVRTCDLSRKSLPLAYTREGNAFQYSGRYADREREPGSDIEVCFGGEISASWVPV